MSHESKMKEAISWKSQKGFFEWLDENNLKSHDLKPKRPKEAFEAALKFNKISRSSSLYKKIGASASYKNCIDSSFLKFLNTLKLWFKI